MKSTLLKPLYRKVVQGLPVLGTPAAAVRRFAPAGGAAEARVDRLITVYTGLSATTGFVLGLPGFLLLPVTLPADVAGTAALQLHLAASVAVLGGRDLDAPETRDQCIACLLEKVDASGTNTEDEEVATRTGLKLAERGVRWAAEKSLKFAGRTAGKLALRRIGLGRLPLVGGVIGAGSDAFMTRHVGRCARAAFIQA